jgi:hypothetical protein
VAPPIPARGRSFQPTETSRTRRVEGSGWVLTRSQLCPTPTSDCSRALTSMSVKPVRIGAAVDLLQHQAAPTPILPTASDNPVAVTSASRLYAMTGRTARCNQHSFSRDFVFAGFHSDNLSYTYQLAASTARLGTSALKTSNLRQCSSPLSLLTSTSANATPFQILDRSTAFQSDTTSKQERGVQPKDSGKSSSSCQHQDQATLLPM